MNPERFARMKDLLLQAAALSLAARPEFLRQVCPDDPELRQEVESILSENRDTQAPLKSDFGMAAAFLLAETPTTVGAAAPSQVPFRPSSPSVPARLGEFRLLRRIGRGGMGTVYEAYQDSMRRQVALKVLDADIGSAHGAVMRFEREAWIGGRLSHPNIVKVYGQGRSGQSYYLAMELVRGTSLQEFLASVRERAQREGKGGTARRGEHVRRMCELFLGVVDALAVVHRRGAPCFRESLWSSVQMWWRSESSRTTSRHPRRGEWSIPSSGRRARAEPRWRACDICCRIGAFRDGSFSSLRAPWPWMRSGWIAIWTNAPPLTFPSR